MPYLMLYYLLLDNVCRTEDEFFSICELSQDLKSGFTYTPQISLFYVKIGEIVMSKILFARTGDTYGPSTANNGP